MTRMFDRLEKSEPALAVCILQHGPEWVEIIGDVGYDVVMVDQMCTSIDWREVHDMFRAARQYNMTPMIRLQGSPWNGGRADAHTASEVLRALSIGAEVITMSVDTAEEVAAVVGVDAGRHERIYLGREFPRDQNWREPLIVPWLESRGAVENIDDILRVPGLRAISLGVGDICRVVGHPSDFEHADVREVLKKIVGKARDKGIMVMASHPQRSEYKFTPVELVRDRVHWLCEIGVSVVYAVVYGYTVYYTMQNIHETVRKGIPSGKAYPPLDIGNKTTGNIKAA